MQKLANVIVFLGPTGIGKKYWMECVAREFTATLHIVPTITTRPLHDSHDRLFYSFAPESDFLKDEKIDDPEEREFWATYERQGKLGVLYYGFSYGELLSIPEERCGLIALSPGHLDTLLSEVRRKMDWLEIAVVRLLSASQVSDGNDVLSQNLRRLGYSEEDIKIHGRLAEEFEASTHAIAQKASMATVYLTGDNAKDRRAVLEAVHAFCPLPLAG